MEIKRKRKKRKSDALSPSAGEQEGKKEERKK